tara:strand:+ start:1175 stop:1576 length:402 start_codon:yes stop_codon:yes gene_type:complete
MINENVLKLASNTINVGLKNRYSHKISLKNTTCGDKITVEIIANKKKINSMKYETESCIYCEASASLLSQRIKNMNFKDFKNDFIIIKKISNQKNIRFPKRFYDLKKLVNSDNLSRLKCVFLPFDAVLKALKL